MRILLSATPAGGHALPLIPLARTAHAAGHDVAILSSADLAPLLRPFEVLTAGPGLQEQMAETRRRTGQDPAQPGPAAVEMFAGTRVDLAYDEAFEQAKAFGPELIVCEPFDFVTPMLAAALDVPWAVLGISGSVPAELLDAMHQRLRVQLAERSLRATPRLAYLDPYPAFLHQEGDTPQPDRIAVRPEAFDRDDDPFELPVFAGEGRRRALLTFGTSVSDSNAEDGAARSLADAGFDVVIAGSQEPGRTSDHIHRAGFVPLARVLPWADVVVSAGGTGTMLAALAAGRPMVVLPFHADQPWNAERLDRAGLARTIVAPGDAGPAAREVVTRPSYRRRAPPGGGGRGGGGPGGGAPPPPAPPPPPPRPPGTSERWRLCPRFSPSWSARHTDRARSGSPGAGGARAEPSSAECAAGAMSSGRMTSLSL
ncbi:glycosyltransferase [Streptomyces sp. 8L]|uniref:glycosyltransferase n=1 Tax=Streptomyces sp. 8L TaxID=2877242 RepID=UPI001CD1DEAA|nr:glycosyltransferase [Streptomyces sp. 8L]MCA1218809.1 glycosyltransferase [Streptomyces sp. 8L]